MNNRNANLRYFILVLCFSLFIGCEGPKFVYLSKDAPKARTSESLKSSPSIKGTEMIPEYTPGVKGKIAYDSDRDRLIFVSYFPVQTWEFVDGSWYQVFTTHTPHDYDGNYEIHWYELIYYPPLKMTLMCVGFGKTYEPDTLLWGFDGNDWTLLSQPGEPSPKQGGVLLYDPKQQRILYTASSGYHSANNFYSITERSYDVWVYNTYGWTRQYIETSFSNYSFDLQAAYDYDRNIIVLSVTFNPACHEYLHRTLEFDWHGWHIPDTDNAAPAPGITYYDPSLHRTVSLEEDNYYYSNSYKLWVYQKGIWLEYAEYELPYPISSYSTIYAIDENMGRLFLYTCSNKILSFTREQGGFLLTDTDRPINDFEALIDYGEYVPWLGGMVFLTSVGCGHDYPLQLWLWDHQSLTKLSELEGLDDELAALVYDPGSQSLLAFTNYNSDTILAFTNHYSDTINVYSYNGFTWTHELAYEVDVEASISALFACYFPPTQRIYLFFTDSYIESEELRTATYKDGQIREIETQISPKKRAGFRVVFDENSGKILLFGGIKYDYNTQYPYCLNDTWEFDGQTWSKRHPTTPPYPRGNGTLLFDTKLQKVLLFGGQCGSTTLADAWVYKNGEWAQLKELTELPHRAAFAAAYDTEQQVTMLWGGYVTEPIIKYLPLTYYMDSKCSLWELTTSAY